MKVYRLEDMTRGWFVGDFAPSALRTPACEVAVRHYAAGESEAAHVHRVAAEVTVIVSGTVRMLDREFAAGDVIRLDPGDATAFTALTACMTVVVKVPSVEGDKYLV